MWAISLFRGRILAWFACFQNLALSKVGVTQHEEMHILPQIRPTQATWNIHLSQVPLQPGELSRWRLLPSFAQPSGGVLPPWKVQNEILQDLPESNRKMWVWRTMRVCPQRGGVEHRYASQDGAGHRFLPFPFQDSLVSVQRQERKPHERWVRVCSQLARLPPQAPYLWIRWAHVV